MQKKLLFFSSVLLLSLTLTFPVFAADGGNLFDIVDAIGGFFSSLGDFILDGLRWLFLPGDDYFIRLSSRIQSAFESKFGGILSLANYLHDRLGNLKPYRGELLVLKYPSDHLFGGAHINLLSGFEGVVDLIRGILSGSLVFMTVSFAYKKVISMINV